MSPEPRLVRSPYLARLALRDGREVVCHVLGRVRLLCDRSALEILASFDEPRAHGGRIVAALRDADILQPEDSDEVDRIRQVFATSFEVEPEAIALARSPASEAAAPGLAAPGLAAPGLAAPGLAAPDTLVLSPALAALAVSEHGFLVTHPLERRLELAADAWRFACEFRAATSIEAVAQRTGMSLAGAIDACRFFLRKQLLWRSHDAEVAQASLAFTVRSTSPVLRLDTGCEQWEQRFRPYALAELGPTTRTALVAAVGGCQIHASTPALQHLGQRRGVAIDVVGWTGVDVAALARDAWSLVLLSLDVPLVAFYEAVALDDHARCRALVRGIAAHVDRTIQQIRAQTAAPILLHSVGHPGLSPAAESTLVLAELNAALRATLAGYDRAHLLDQDRVVAAHVHGLHWDDEYNALRHHSCISIWGRPPRDLAFPRYPASTPPVPERQGDPAAPFALAHLDFLDRLDVRSPVELIVFEPDDLLWPGKLEHRPGPFPDSFNFYTGDHVSKHLGLHEALVAHADRGVVLGCVSSCPIEVLRERWRLPARLATLLQLERVSHVAGGDLTAATVAQIIRASGVPAQRVLLVNLPPALIPDGFAGRVVRGVPWSLRRYLLTAPELHPVGRQPVRVERTVALRAPRRSPVLDLVAYRRAVRDIVASKLRAPVDAIEACGDLRALGLDSLAGLEVVSELERRFEIELPDEDKTTGIVFSLPALADATLRACRRAAASASASVGAAAQPARIGPDGFCALDIPTVIARHLAAPPSPWAFKFLRSTRPRDYEYVSWPQLGDHAAAYLGLYRSLGLVDGDVITLLLPQGPALVAAVVAALLGRMLPAVAPAPGDKLPERSFVQWFGKLIAASGSRLIVCEAELEPTIARELEAHAISARVSSARPVPRSRLELPDLGDPRPDVEALVQYSSGTTGVKKAVVLTHRAVLSQVTELAAALELDARDVIVTWLPLYHDMGYVACCLLPLLRGIPTVMMSPFDWLVRPELLFEQLSEERGTLAWLPNFAFSLCANRVRDAQLANLDLSSVRAVINCSEPITLPAMTRFADMLSPYGLRRSALSASYAMAETTFAVTQTTPGREPRRLAVVRTSLTGGRTVELATHRHAPADVVVLVSSGRELARTRVQIVGDDGAACPDGVAGEIRIESPSAMAGYFRDPAATAAAMNGPWYASGDVGLVWNGELYVTGREKDLIIVAGRNLYPHELEDEIGRLDGVKAGRVVGFGIFDEEVATERAVVLAEVTWSAADTDKLAALASEIRALVLAEFAVTLADVRLYTEPVLHKTTSGKLSRERIRDDYLRALAAR